MQYYYVTTQALAVCIRYETGRQGHLAYGSWAGRLKLAKLKSFVPLQYVKAWFSNL